MTARTVSHPDVDDLTLRPASPTIGAYIDGIDLALPLSRGRRDWLYQALLDWKVLFFRDQDISTDEHLDFARNFGELEVHPFAPHKPDYPEILAITHNRDRAGSENIWHSDVTWRQEPSLGSILRCLECPELGGDTLFADMYAAYEGLPEAVREEVEGRLALHDFSGFRDRMRARGVDEALIEEHKERYPNPEHPVIRTHPDTGRKAIYVNRAFTKHIIGLNADESERLLSLLCHQAAIPEYQCRFQWRANSIVFWDNRACQHYANSDYWPQVRSVERATVIGDKPYYEDDRPPQDLSETPFQGLLARQRAGSLLDAARY